MEIYTKFKSTNNFKIYFYFILFIYLFLTKEDRLMYAATAQSAVKNRQQFVFIYFFN